MSAPGFSRQHPSPPAVRPRRRTGRLLVLVTAVVAVPVAAVLAVVALLPGPGGDDTSSLAPAAVPQPVDAATATGQAPAPTTPTATPDGSTAGRDAQPVTADRALSLLSGAGSPTTGTVDLAWTWSDRNGLNLLAGTREEPGGSAPVTLRVVQLAGLDGRPDQLRAMRDPLSCSDGDVDAGFLDGSLSLRDLDADGVVDVVLGWWAVCGDASEPAQVKVAVVSDGRKFILRGSGYVADVQGPDGATAARFEADPVAQTWPPEFYAAATGVFGELVR